MTWKLEEDSRLIAQEAERLLSNRSSSIEEN
jgi:hypothetical protein